MRKYDAAFNGHAKEVEGEPSPSWRTYLAKVAVNYVAAEYAARGEWKVDPEEFGREVDHLSDEMVFDREARPRRTTAERGRVPGPVRPLPDHIVRGPFEPVRRATTDGEPIHEGEEGLGNGAVRGAVATLKPRRSVVGGRSDLRPP